MTMTAKRIPKPADDDQTGTNRRGSFIFAGQLHAGHIGIRIRFFTWHEDLNISTVTTADLRQIYHNSGETTLNYGEMASGEITVDHKFPIWLEPCQDFSEVPNYLVPALPEFRDGSHDLPELLG